MTAEPLSTRDLQDTLRTLSDDAIYEITGVSQPKVWAVLRNAMIHAAYDCGLYCVGEEDQFFVDFMRELDMAGTLQRVRLGQNDVYRYMECFSDLVYNGELEKGGRVILVTQCFDAQDIFRASWLTVMSGDNSVWVFIDADWGTIVYDDVAELHMHAFETIGPIFSIAVYANRTEYWPQVFAATRSLHSGAV